MKKIDNKEQFKILFEQIYREVYNEILQEAYGHEAKQSVEFFQKRFDKIEKMLNKFASDLSVASKEFGNDPDEKEFGKVFQDMHDMISKLNDQYKQSVSSFGELHANRQKEIYGDIDNSGTTFVDPDYARDAWASGEPVSTRKRWPVPPGVGGNKFLPGVGRGARKLPGPIGKSYPGGSWHAQAKKEWDNDAADAPRPPEKKKSYLDKLKSLFKEQMINEEFITMFQEEYTKLLKENVSN